LLTVAFRFLTNYPEGVATAILTMNMLVFIIDRIGAKVRFNLRWLLILNLILFMLITSTTGYIAFNIKKVDDKDLSFQILNIKRQDQQTIYQVTHKAFHGIIKADITINHVDNKITDIIIIEQKEDVWSQIENADYLKKIIHNQADLDKLDTIAGATYTTNYLKQMAIKVMDDYHKRKEEYK
ncbi:MAG: FMN-binding protein, partial [Bacilli bacterium]